MRLQSAYRGGYVGRPGWWLTFDFDEDVIAYLKGFQQGTHRAWDPEGKRWWISEEIVEEVVKVIPQLQAYLKQGQLL